LQHWPLGPRTKQLPAPCTVRDLGIETLMLACIVLSVVALMQQVRGSALCSWYLGTLGRCHVCAAAPRPNKGQGCWRVCGLGFLVRTPNRYFRYSCSCFFQTQRVSVSLAAESGYAH
jgi:hypothetical protein